MNIKEYIQSGIIESCVLGLATVAERREFEALCSAHAELVEARMVFELELENLLVEEALAPPAVVKEKLLQSIIVPGINGEQEKVTPLRSPAGSINIWKYVSAACMVAIAAIAYWAYSVNNKYQSILTSNLQTANQYDHASHAESVKALKSIVQKPSVKWSIMVEPTNETHCMAHIYWDTLSKNTFLLLGNIPRAVSDKQFQLWAILDNHPVNLGIFDAGNEGQLIQMKNINNAKSFAITIEPKGGSITPSLNDKYAIGEF